MFSLLYCTVCGILSVRTDVKTKLAQSLKLTLSLYLNLFSYLYHYISISFPLSLSLFLSISFFLSNSYLGRCWGGGSTAAGRTSSATSVLSTVLRVMLFRPETRNERMSDFQALHHCAFDSAQSDAFSA